MKKVVLTLIVGVMMVMTAGAVVKPGVEVLRDGGFAQLQGKRVGLVTNPSGIDNNLKSTACAAMPMRAMPWATPWTR